jgi:hypothetical protein
MTKVLIALLTVPALCVTLAAADLSGVWTLNFDADFGGHPGSADCTFKQDGARLQIQCGSGAPTTGKINEQKVTFQTKTGLHNELTATFTADLDRQGTTMKGTWHLVDQDKKDLNGKFEAKKN